MLSKKQREKRGWVGVKTLVNPKTGETITIDFEETPVFTREECERLNIGQPNMKPYSEMTEEELRIFSRENEEETE